MSRDALAATYMCEVQEVHARYAPLMMAGRTGWLAARPEEVGHVDYHVERVRHVRVWSAVVHLPLAPCAVDSLYRLYVHACQGHRIACLIQ